RADGIGSEHEIGERSIEPRDVRDETGGLLPEEPSLRRRITCHVDGPICESLDRARVTESEVRPAGARHRQCETEVDSAIVWLDVDRKRWRWIPGTSEHLNGGSRRPPRLDLSNDRSRAVRLLAGARRIPGRIVVEEGQGAGQCGTVRARRQIVLLRPIVI